MHSMHGQAQPPTDNVQAECLRILNFKDKNNMSIIFGSIEPFSIQTFILDIFDLSLCLAVPSLMGASFSFLLL